jgi:hypothetical protein
MSRSEVTGDELLKALVEGTKLMERSFGEEGPAGAVAAGLTVIESTFKAAAFMAVMLEHDVGGTERSAKLNRCASVVSRVKDRL